jgi:hypothetical protein
MPHESLSFAAPISEFRFKAGHVTGFQRIQSNSTLSELGDESIGRARMDFLDANWNVVFSTTDEGKGTRLETPGQD